MSSQFTSVWQQILQVSQIKTRDAGERPFWTVSVFDEKLENRSLWCKKYEITLSDFLMITQTTDWGYSVSQQVKRTCEIIVTYSLFCRCYSIIQRRWRKTTPPILCWHYTAQNVLAKRPQPPRSVISIIIYPIPSDLGSQDDSSQASSTVGDHVRSPGTERFSFSACLIWRSTNTLIRWVFGSNIKASSNTFSPKILKQSVKGTWSLDCRKKLYFCPHLS